MTRMACTMNKNRNHSPHTLHNTIYRIILKTITYIKLIFEKLDCKKFMYETTCTCIYKSVSKFYG